MKKITVRRLLVMLIISSIVLGISNLSFATDEDQPSEKVAEISYYPAYETEYPYENALEPYHLTITDDYFKQFMKKNPQSVDLYIDGEFQENLKLTKTKTIKVNGIRKHEFRYTCVINSAGTHVMSIKLPEYPDLIIPPYTLNVLPKTLVITGFWRTANSSNSIIDLFEYVGSEEVFTVTATAKGLRDESAGAATLKISLTDENGKVLQSESGQFWQMNRSVVKMAQLNMKIDTYNLENGKTYYVKAQADSEGYVSGISVWKFLVTEEMDLDGILRNNWLSAKLDELRKIKDWMKSDEWNSLLEKNKSDSTSFFLDSHWYNADSERIQGALRMLTKRIDELEAKENIPDEYVQLANTPVPDVANPDDHINTAHNDQDSEFQEVLEPDSEQVTNDTGYLFEPMPIGFSKQMTYEDFVKIADSNPQSVSDFLTGYQYVKDPADPCGLWVNYESSEGKLDAVIIEKDGSIYKLYWSADDYMKLRKKGWIYEEGRIDVINGTMPTGSIDGFSYGFYSLGDYWRPDENDPEKKNWYFNFGWTEATWRSEDYWWKKYEPTWETTLVESFSSEGSPDLSQNQPEMIQEETVSVSTNPIATENTLDSIKNAYMSFQKNTGTPQKGMIRYVSQIPQTTKVSSLYYFDDYWKGIGSDDKPSYLCTYAAYSMQASYFGINALPGRLRELGAPPRKQLIKLMNEEGISVTRFKNGEYMEKMVVDQPQRNFNMFTYGYGAINDWEDYPSLEDFNSMFYNWSTDVTYSPIFMYYHYSFLNSDGVKKSGYHVLLVISKDTDGKFIAVDPAANATSLIQINVGVSKDGYLCITESTANSQKYVGAQVVQLEYLKEE